jgi:hypothetical protein
MIKILIGNIHGLFRQDLPLRYYVSLFQPEQRTVVDRSGMIRTQLGRTIDQKWSQLHGMLCTIPPRKSNQWPVNPVKHSHPMHLTFIFIPSSHLRLGLQSSLSIPFKFSEQERSNVTERNRNDTLNAAKRKTRCLRTCGHLAGSSSFPCLYSMTSSDLFREQCRYKDLISSTMKGTDTAYKADSIEAIFRPNTHQLITLAPRVFVFISV